MIDGFLRRLPVRFRIVSAFLILVALLLFTIPLLLANRDFLFDQVQQLANVYNRTDRLLLLASARVESSRVNLMRYTQDRTASPDEALADVGQATQLLEEAQSLVVSPAQRADVDSVLVALGDYEQAFGEAETARAAGEEQKATGLLLDAYRTGKDIGQRIEQIVQDSEAIVAAANQAVYTRVQQRMLYLGIAYIGTIVLALFLSALIQRSITRPIADLRKGTDRFRQGNLDVSVPVVGSDELSVLTQDFNEMVAQYRELIVTLEQLVAERTRDLERRAMQLAMAADVGQAATSILEPQPLARKVVNLVLERFGLYYVGLFLLDGAGRYAVLEAGTGPAGRTMMEQGHKLEVGGTSMVGAACAQRQARVALDTGEEAARFDNPLLPLTRSEMALPLVVGDRVLGALDVQSTRTGAFGDQDVAILQLVANQVAVAVDNARRFSDEAALLESTSPIFRVSRRLAGAGTTEEITQAIIDSVAETEADGCFVAAFNLAPEGRVETVTFLDNWDRRGTNLMPLGVPMPPSTVLPLETAMDFLIVKDVSRDPRLPPQTREYLSSLGVRSQVNIPLRSGQRPLGFISVSRGTSGQFSPVALQLYETLADQASIALERARLLEAAQQRAAQERLVGDAAARMRETLDMDAVLRTAAAEMRRALDLHDVTIQLGGDAVLARSEEEGSS